MNAEGTGAKASPQMQQLTITIREQDQWQNRPLYLALIELVRAAGLGGATVVKGMAGYSAPARLIRTVGFVEVSANLPVVVFVVDEASRISEILPQVQDMIAVSGGLIAVQNLAGYFYSHPGRRAAPLRRVAQIMETDVATVAPDLPVAELLPLLLHKPYTALPVLDASRHVLGMVTEGDLLKKPGLGLRLSVLEELQERGGSAYADIVRALEGSGKKAGDVMGVRNDAVVGPDASLEEAGRIMIRTGVKRLPVVDGERRLLGIVSRIDLLRIADQSARSEEPLPPTGGQTVGEVMLGGTATVMPDATIDQVVAAFVGSGGIRRVVVIDNPDDRRVLGMITETDLVGRIATPARPGLLRSLVDGLQVLGPSAGAPPQALPRSENTRASEIMTRPAITVPTDTSIRDAVGTMLARRIKALPVVDETGRLVGLVDRKRLLQALIAADGAIA